jgi:hypothetical protein
VARAAHYRKVKKKYLRPATIKIKEKIPDSEDLVLFNNIYYHMPTFSNPVGKKKKISTSGYLHRTNLMDIANFVPSIFDSMSNFSSYIIVSISRKNLAITNLFHIGMYRLFWYKLCRPDKTSENFPSQGGHSVQMRGFRLYCDYVHCPGYKKLLRSSRSHRIAVSTLRSDDRRLPCLFQYPEICRLMWRVGEGRLSS